ncbi:MAG: helix-turn-helix domain-containing protein [Candidatus Margulisbacteria bacterium]|jgi:transcriptional regulator with XRE-family HTH domain|nr:helix-turn-helix domain-containing protein [Candidatus Margulisiibacteriota bacterium]
MGNIMHDIEQIKIHIGKRLKALRTKRGLTIEVLTGLLDIALPNYLYLEKGARGAPKLETLCKLADFYAVPLDYFFKDYAPEDPPPAQKNILEKKLLNEFRRLKPGKQFLSIQVVRGLAQPK